MRLLPLRVGLLVLPLVCAAVTPTRAERRLVLAQAQIEIPSDAQLDRMERQGIATPPLYDGDAPGGGTAAENRRMEEQARRIDEKLRDGGICSGC